MSERDGDLGSFLSGLMIGGLVGAAVAFLMAPQSGEETRTLIKEKGIELRDCAKETAEEPYAKAETAASEARARADELSKLARDRADELKQRGQVVLEEQKSRLEDVIDAVKGTAQNKSVKPAAQKKTKKSSASSTISIANKKSCSMSSFFYLNTFGISSNKSPAKIEVAPLILISTFKPA